MTRTRALSYEAILTLSSYENLSVLKNTYIEIALENKYLRPRLALESFLPSCLKHFAKDSEIAFYRGFFYIFGAYNKAL